MVLHINEVRSVSIIDPHPMVRHGMKCFLTERDYLIKWEADCAVKGKVLLADCCPEILIYEPVFDTYGASDFIRYVRDSKPSLKIVIQTMAAEGAGLVDFLKLGVLALISKKAEPSELLVALEYAHQGTTYVSPGILDGIHLPAKSKPCADTQLSQREQEVFRLVGLGYKASEIAIALGISPRTVDAHKQHIKDKLSVPNQASLAALARDHSTARPKVDWEIQERRPSHNAPSTAP